MHGMNGSPFLYGITANRPVLAYIHIIRMANLWIPPDLVPQGQTIFCVTIIATRRGVALSWVSRHQGDTVHNAMENKGTGYGESRQRKIYHPMASLPCPRSRYQIPRYGGGCIRRGPRPNAVVRPPRFIFNIHLHLSIFILTPWIRRALTSWMVNYHPAGTRIF